MTAAIRSTPRSSRGSAGGEGARSRKAWRRRSSGTARTGAGGSRSSPASSPSTTGSSTRTASARSASLGRGLPMPRRLSAFLLVTLAFVAGASAQTVPDTVSVTTFAISGHGWGHGVGMAQWGAYGYALHGFTYDRILSHYYPGAQLASTPAQLVRVLLGENLRRVTVGSDSPFRVKDASAVVHRLKPGSYTFGPGLKLQGNRLPGPLTFLPGATPLRLAHAYRGSL